MGVQVSLVGVSDEKLAFLGYEVVYENSEFKLYCHRPTGDEHVVQLRAPRLRVEDVNDAIELGLRGALRTPDAD